MGKLRAVINARVSGTRKENREELSLDDQIDRCAAYCASRDYEVVWVNREVHTGYELDERDGMWHILKMIEHREVDVVVQTVLDRLARNYQHETVLEYTADKYGVSLEFVDETFDDTPEGRAMRAMKGVFAEVERKTIADRLLRGRRNRAKSGKMIPGNMPLYGYRWADEEKSAYVLHEETAPIVARIYREAAACKTLMAITRDLARDGILTPRDQWRKDRGDPNDPPREDNWRRQTVYQILTNPSYTGNHAAYRNDFTMKRRHVDDATGRAQTTKVHRIRLDNHESVVLLPNAAPAIVSEQLASAVRERLSANKQESPRRNKRTQDALLRGGYIKCSVCGKNLHVHSRVGGTGSYYYCPSKKTAYEEPTQENKCPTAWMNVKETDAAVWAIIYQVISDPRRLVSEIMRRIEDTTMTDDALEAYEHKIVEIDRQLANLARTIAQMDDPEDAAPFVARSKELGVERRGILDARGQAEVARAQRHQLRDKLTDFEQWCRAFADHPELWTLERKRLALYALEITVYANTHDDTDPFTVKAGPENDNGERITLQAGFNLQAVRMDAASRKPSSSIIDSFMMNFWILPVTVIGKASTNFQ